jgi:hypothetical protein
VLVRILLTVPGTLVREPILCEVNRAFPAVTTNLRGTSITPSLALVAIDLVGEAAQIQAAIDHMRAKGVKVDVSQE